MSVFIAYPVGHVVEQVLLFGEGCRTYPALHTVHSLSAVPVQSLQAALQLSHVLSELFSHLSSPQSVTQVEPRRYHPVEQPIH